MSAPPTHATQCAVLLAESTRIAAADLFPDRAADDRAEREHIRRVPRHCGGCVTDVAHALGVSRTTLWERMRRLGVPAR